MKNTLFIYILMGALFIVPLILFNVRKIWVHRPPHPIRFKPGRLLFVLLTSALIVTFLVTAYQATIRNRYEIAIERIAEKHAEVLTGKSDMSAFRDFVIGNGTDKVSKSFDATVFPATNDSNSARFQLSNWCIPKYWVNVEGFEQVGVVDDNNPVYLMYLLEAGGRKEYYVIRMVNTKDGWKYDWFGNANEAHRKTIKMPTLKNGKWYTVTR